MTEKVEDIDVGLERMPKKELPPFQQMLIPGCAVSSGIMLGSALPDLTGAENLLDYLKCVVIALAATGTAYGINRLAIEKGTVQSAIGTMGAAALSTVSILAVGAGMFAATYAGFTLHETDRLRLEGYGVALAEYIDDRATHARAGEQVEPVLAAVVNDLTAKAACERRSSCVSGVGDGGEGANFRIISGAAQTGDAILAELASGKEARQAALDRLRALQASYRGVVDDDGLSVKERRSEAHGLVIEIDQTATALEAASSSVLIEAYARDLAGGGAVSSPQTAPARRLLAAHGQQLRGALGGASEESPVRPTFPGRTGVADTFGFAGHFFPIAMIVGVVELIFPLALWLYTYFALVARLDQDQPRPRAPRASREKAARRSSPRARR